MKKGIAFFLLCLGLSAGTPCSAGDAGAATPQRPTLEAKIVSVTPDGSSATLAVGGSTAVPLPVEGFSAQDLLRKALPGDRATLQVDDKAAPKTIQGVVSITRHFPGWTVLAALACGMALALAFACVATSVHPSRLFTGDDNRYSKSKFQMTAWFGTVVIVYIATLVMRVLAGGLDFLGGVEIPENMLMLSGLSGLTYGAAKAITVKKVNNALQSGNAAAGLKGPGNTPQLSDFFQDDTGNVDLGDSQAMFITLLAIGLYLLGAYHFLGSVTLVSPIQLPDVDQALLVGFGLGQGAYLIKKGVSATGQG